MLFCFVSRESEDRFVQSLLIGEGEVWSFVICSFVTLRYILLRKLCIKKDKFHYFGVL